jgi:sugar phosphate isomerase/epimerase
MKYHIIPNLDQLDEYLSLSKKYNLGFEYNEFFMPDFLDNEDKAVKTILEYQSLNRKNDTLHGVFFDIVLDSMDKKIRDISLERVKSSLRVASMLKCKGVVFHTNYNTWMKDENYKNRWLKYNKEAYLKLINEFKD